MPAESERFRYLLLLLDQHFLRWNAGTHVDFSVAIKELSGLISNFECAISDPTRSGVIFGRQSVINGFLDAFERPFGELLKASQPVRDEFLFLWGDAPSLSSQLTITNHLRIVSEDIKNVVQIIDECLCPSTGEVTPLRMVAEKLHVIAEIIEAIDSAISSAKFFWCNVCFRRAREGFLYCDEHYSSSEPSQDTKNRRAKRQKENDTDEFLLHWGRYKSLRNLLPDKFTILSSQEDAPDSVANTDRYLLVSPQEKSLAFQTWGLQWVEVAPIWDQLIKSEFPAVYKQIVMLPSEFETWRAFVSKLLTALRDKHERTHHPIWILRILVAAEGWLSVERKDGRITGKAAKILELFLAGTTDPTVLSQVVGVSKTYVHKVIKDEGLRGE